MAAVPADVITLAFGTNCWGMIAFSEDLLEATVRAFVASLRAGHPRTPIVAVSPIVRPDAEARPNRLGATLAGLRAAYERAVLGLGAADAGITLVRGGELVRADQLADGIHPDDAGHAALAVAVGAAVGAALLLIHGFWVQVPGGAPELSRPFRGLLLCIGRLAGPWWVPLWGPTAGRCGLRVRRRSAGRRSRCFRRPSSWAARRPACAGHASRCSARGRGARDPGR
jgi:hypothetical protein